MDVDAPHENENQQNDGEEMDVDPPHVEIVPC